MRAEGDFCAVPRTVSWFSHRLAGCHDAGGVSLRCDVRLWSAGMNVTKYLSSWCERWRFKEEDGSGKRCKHGAPVAVKFSVGFPQS